MIKAVLVIGFVLMVYNLVRGLQLRQVITGGLIGERLTQLIVFIGLFAAGYLGITALVWAQPQNTLLVLLSLLLLFGAVFVFLVLRLVYSIAEVLEG